MLVCSVISFISLFFSWRMRVALAQALFVNPDILLLDEPTNHLDFPAVLWLEEYLCKYEKTLIIVSHDRSFLNNVITDTVHYYQKQLNYYRGNYDVFEKGEKGESSKSLLLTMYLLQMFLSLTFLPFFFCLPCLYLSPF